MLMFDQLHCRPIISVLPAHCWLVWNTFCLDSWASLCQAMLDLLLAIFICILLYLQILFKYRPNIKYKYMPFCDFQIQITNTKNSIFKYKCKYVFEPNPGHKFTLYRHNWKCIIIKIIFFVCSLCSIKLLFSNKLWIIGIVYIYKSLSSLSCVFAEVVPWHTTASGSTTGEGATSTNAPACCQCHPARVQQRTQCFHFRPTPQTLCTEHEVAQTESAKTKVNVVYVWQCVHSCFWWRGINVVCSIWVTVL